MYTEAGKIPLSHPKHLQDAAGASPQFKWRMWISNECVFQTWLSAPTVRCIPAQRNALGIADQ
jgi:hypothetical protein